MEPAVTRPPGLFTRFIQAASQRIASDPSVPPENREALAHAAEHVLWAQWRDLVGDDLAKMRAPKRAPADRQAKTARIVTAIQAGEPHAQIARRERINKSTVCRIAQRTVAK